MPSKSIAQQKFMALVKSAQAGKAKVKGKAKKAAKDMKKSDVDDFASTKHKGLPYKVKKEEIQLKNAIRSIVEKFLNEGFAGALPESDQDEFEKTRQKQAEVLGYKLTGKSDVKVKIGNATIKEGKLSEATDSYVVWSPLLNKVYDGPVSEKKALMLIKKYAKQGQYHVGMLGTKYFNKTKLGKKNPVKEGKLNEAKPYETILKQLGGNRFIAMTGAKNLGTNGKDLSFHIGRNSKNVSHVHIKLTSMDLYDVEFINMRGAKRKVLKKVKGVYGDMLPKIFKKYTGMNVRL